MEGSLLLKELTWDQVSNDVKDLNPEFASIINNLSPSKEFTFFRASYPYGNKILHRGKLFLPASGNKLVPIDNDQVPNHVKKKIGYNLLSNPVTLVLKKSLDLFISVEKRIVNYSIIPPGSIFGLWRIIDNPNVHNLSHVPPSIWDMTAGARSIFMLPKISDVNGFNRLQKKYAIQNNTPKSLIDHWSIFREIYNQIEFENNWETELLYFSDKWFEHINDKAWKDLKIYFLQSAWKSTEFWRNQFTWELTFSRIQEDRNIKPSPYIADIVSHLLAIGVGTLPGFRPAIDDNVAPVRALQKVFEEVYGIDYAPIIMEPALSPIFERNKRPLYYSLNFQTAIKLSQKSSRSSMVAHLYNIKSLLTKYRNDILQGDLNIGETPLYEMAKIANFSFFHHNSTEYKNIFPSMQAIIEDHFFSQSCIYCKQKEMPKNAPFLNGCIRISSTSQRSEESIP